VQSLDFERHQRCSAVEAITTSERGYSALRDATRSATGAAIPFLGLSLTDLTFLEEGAPDLLEPPAINWLKCERRFSILTEIFERGARDLSNLDLDPATQDLHHLIELLDLSEMDACSRSLRIEPRRIDSGVPSVSNIIDILQASHGARASDTGPPVAAAAATLDDEIVHRMRALNHRQDDDVTPTSACDIAEWLVTLVSVEMIKHHPSLAAWLLHSSVELELLAVVRRLLELGLDPDVRLDNGQELLATSDSDTRATALFACRSSEMMQLLVSCKADLEARNQWLQTPLIAAAHDGDAVRVRRLIALNANVNARMDGGFTALHVGASRHSKELVLELLSARADAAALSLWRSSTTMEAALSNDTKVTKLLLYYHAPGTLIDQPLSGDIVRLVQSKLSAEMNEMLSESRVAELQAYGVWRHDTHFLASDEHRQAIRVLMEIYALERSSLIGAMPRELLWLLFSFLNC